MPDHSNMEVKLARPIKDREKRAVKISRVKRKILSHVTLVRIVLVILAIFVIFMIASTSVNLAGRLNLPFYSNVLYNFLKAPVERLASDNGRTNILVMGKAGGEHDGPDLTDTIILLSVNFNEGKIMGVSIPRDTWLPDIRAKVNSAYYWGNQKNVGGINFVKAETSQIVGVPIHYGAIIDFSGFKDVIDKLGGVEVDVQNSFTDYYYPIAGRENDSCGGRDPLFSCRYETLTFNKGHVIMDGATALKFVRSRHAEGIEGTDIAREARQGLVIDALKNKLSDKNTYKDPRRVSALLKVFLNSIETDIDYPTAAILARKVYDFRNSIKSYIIPSELLVSVENSPLYDNQSVFVPKKGNGKWEDIQLWYKNLQ